MESQWRVMSIHSTTRPSALAASAFGAAGLRWLGMR